MIMKDTIDKFKMLNGDKDFTQKEMLMYVIDRVDKIDNKLGEGAGKIACSRAKIKGITKVLVLTAIVGLPLLCATIGWLFIRTTGCD